MDAYIYRAALYCEDCGEAIRKKLTADGCAPADPADEYTYDSDVFPKGPFDNGGGEADTPQHCAACGVFLKNPLTTEGYRYVQAELEDCKNPGEFLREWMDYYEIKETYTVARAVLIAYPNAVKADADGFYYENADTPPAKFHFPTFEEAAEDLAIEMGLSAAEAHEILARGSAVK